MKKSVMTKWVKALRSGKYLQGKGQLKDEEGNYCCLGVLCEISKLDNFDSLGIYLGQISVLPKLVMEWSGITNSCGYLKKPGRIRNINHDHLTDLNDNGASFKRIANIIEKEYKDL